MSFDSRRAIERLFGAYFNQDWEMDAESPDEVIEQFIRDGIYPGHLSAIADGLDAWAAQFGDDAALEDALYKDLGGYYCPSAHGLNARLWVQHVASRLRSAE
jgi:hypothetical protein